METPLIRKELKRMSKNSVIIKLLNTICYIVLVNIVLCNTAFSALTVIHIEPAEFTSQKTDAMTDMDKMEQEACLNWRLSNVDIVKIFENSAMYQDREVISRHYYWLPCEIKGTLTSENKEWNFTINAAAYAEWNDGHKSIYWGCAKDECESLFLLPYDGMAG